MEDLNKRYKRNQDFVFRKIQDETILVPIKTHVENMDCIYNLNEVGTLVWEMLNGENRLVDIVNRMCEDFEVSADVAERDLFEFLGELEEMGAIG